jgi:hypothetical protein
MSKGKPLELGLAGTAECTLLVEVQGNKIGANNFERGGCSLIGLKRPQVARPPLPFQWNK